ncbi:FadR/GntR family transcriptional regulator, partial [Frankia sp. ACN1ag]|uniref:FadR/GntR family transcriptional regulator n=1 Tax=Frankia sp. ACN1ag TaxID=102891 RepID=UPI00070801B9
MTVIPPPRARTDRPVPVGASAAAPPRAEPSDRSAPPSGSAASDGSPAPTGPARPGWPATSARSATPGRGGPPRKGTAAGRRGRRGSAPPADTTTPPHTDTPPRTDTPAHTAAVRIGRHVRVPKTAELVAAHLRRQIVRGELHEDDALPPEAVLMEQFGVSRPTLREAFRVLESEALISVRRGAHGGARVHTPNGHVAARYTALVLEHQHTTLADIHTAHTHLEPAAIRLLATTATDTHLTHLTTHLTTTDHALATPHPNPTDIHTHHLNFHTLLLTTPANHTLTMISSMLRHILDATTPDT